MYFLVFLSVYCFQPQYLKFKIGGHLHIRQYVTVYLCLISHSSVRKAHFHLILISHDKVSYEGFLDIHLISLKIFKKSLFSTERK